MIHIFDTYHQASWDLHFSLLCSGYNNPTIVLEDDGFLPDDVTSPYRFFTNYDAVQGKPLYYNQVKTPAFWEIRGDNSQAEIYDFATKRAQIHYAHPSHKRLVKAVDWYDEAGRLVVTDRYNDKGRRFGQTSYDRQGQATQTSYYQADGQEVLIENHGTGDLILNYQGHIYFFKNRNDWMNFYLKTAGFQLDRIFYNSLAQSFLTAFYLDEDGEDILFWQEPITDSIPGNMLLLLNKQSRRPTKVVVQDEKTYQQIVELATPEQREKIFYLGFLYPLKEQKALKPEALILTNSDQIEQLEKLVNRLPQLHFHIGAITEMSSRLMGFGQYDNVTLYPNISMDQVQDLYYRTSLYLDINHGGEILAAVRTAFEHRSVILAFQETLHSPTYIARENTYVSTQVEAMIAKIEALLAEGDGAVSRLLAIQEEEANVTTVLDYQRVVD
ncbi:TPA: accessory Sec system glycosylation chaperone GtfB [Streptococcus suis]|nr:accessory Sec system glycosylation chaperone GtfB [Streptococcus suis]HEM2548763.1 accessory Sec system glycosylation chaperone GtfB [Streptococcus suis]